MQAGHFTYPERSCRLRVHAIQSFEESPPHSPATSKAAPLYKIVWIKSGSGYIVTGKQHYAICSNVVCCFAPEQSLQIIRETALEGFCITVASDFFYAVVKECDLSYRTSLPYGYRRPGMIAMDEPTMVAVETVLRHMSREFAGDAPLQQEILQGFFRLMLLYLSRTGATSVLPELHDRESMLVKDFRLMLFDHIATKKLVSDYAQALHVSPGHLNHAVKKVSGYTASYHIQQQIIQEAKHLATYSGCSMKEIAYDLGFNDIAHFSKFFKNYSGTNFTDFKKSGYYEP